MRWRDVYCDSRTRDLCSGLASCAVTMPALDFMQLLDRSTARRLELCGNQIFHNIRDSRVHFTYPYWHILSQND
ncbi:hypothetical protein J6590_033033 [Homalodisca vitripennis]|nr:hypothetical protein J6590_033033 [Homalodisca vitripennis]